nr:hypothetical protein [Tanacetum cinerariifolium]
MVEGTENVDADKLVNTIFNSQNDLDTRLEPKSCKECLEVEITNVVQPVNIIDEEDESVKDDYELGRRIHSVITNQILFHVDSSVRSYMSSHILHVHPTQASQNYVQEQEYQLYLTMKDDLQMQCDDLPIWLALKIKFKGLIANNTMCRSPAIRPRDQDNHHDDAHPEGENNAKK